MDKKLDTNTLTNRVSEHLKYKIITGELAPGERVIQSTIADELGVSRIPVRESIHSLVGEGLLDMKAHYGAVVAPISVDLANEIFGARAILEPRILRASIPHMTPETFRSAKEHLAVMSKKNKKRKDFKEWSISHWAFHKTLYAPSGQKVLLSMIRGLVQHSERFMFLELTQHNTSRDDEFEHSKILASCKERDIDGACKMLEQHISKTPSIVASSAQLD